jgi:predicted DNA-binding transcriptional regulator AlpA
VTLAAVPTVAEIVANPGRIAELPPAVALELHLRILGVQTALALRALTSASADGPGAVAQPDRLLTAKEAGTLLGVSPDWLYRRSNRLPFTVRLGRALRFSASGIEKYLRARRGASVP